MSMWSSPIMALKQCLECGQRMTPSISAATTYYTEREC